MLKNDKPFALLGMTATIFGILAAAPAQAVCPICTVAVGAGVGLSRWLGVDDTITGLWVGGVTMSMSLWTINWLNKKNIRFYGRKILILAAFYALVIAPLYWSGITGHPFNTLWGVDKLLLGIIIGSIWFLASARLYVYLKKRNNDRAHFPFEKIVLGLAPLALMSFIFYLITR